MTPDEIEKAANERYKIKKGMCKRERDDILRLRRRFIERMSLQIK